MRNDAEGECSALILPLCSSASHRPGVQEGEGGGTVTRGKHLVSREEIKEKKNNSVLAQRPSSYCQESI